jgi:ABC-type antimicrobial peptide transport system permease subunit
MILLWIGDELSFDRQHKNADHIYRILFNMKYPDGSINTWWNAPQPLEAVLEEEYPEVENAVVVSWNGDRLLSLDKENYKKKGIYASEDMFEMFETTFLAGDEKTALKDKNSIVITDELAAVIFGNDWQEKEVIGTSLEVNKENLLKITAVVPTPKRNSSIQYEYVIPFEFGLDKQPWNREWGNYNNRMFVKLREGVDLVAFNEKVKDVIKTHHENNAGDEAFAFLYPLEKVYLYGNFENGVSTGGGRIEYIRIFGVVSAFVLILACINFMNLATARSFRRAKEVGVRKVVGAGKKSLILQFVGESIIVTFISMMLAVLLTSLLLPTFNLLTNKELTIDFANLRYWIYGLEFLLITGLLAGFYPAFVISGFKPVKVLKGSLSTSQGTGFMRKSLVVFQFFLSIFMIAGTLVVHLQIDFIMNRNLGLDKENVLVYQLNQESYPHFNTLKNDIIEHPEFERVTTCNQNPLNVGSSATGMEWEGKKEGEEIEFSHLWVTYDFVETLGLELADGRDFSREFASDSSAFLVNEAAVEVMGLENPVGSTFNAFWIEDGKIIGVVKDFHSNSIYSAVEPLIIVMDTEPYILYIRTASGKTQEAIEQLAEIHKKYSPSYPFDYYFMNEQYEHMYKSEIVMSSLANYFALLAITISCLGLLGLASLTTAQKVKEIGIRKVFGASVMNVLVLLSRDYVKLIILAFAISIPVINYFITDWLSQFEYKIELGWWMYPVSGVLVLAIALLAVSWQSFRAAVANPVNSLRDE